MPTGAAGYGLGAVQFIAGIALNNPMLMIGGLSTIAGTGLANRRIGGDGGFDRSSTYGFDSPRNSNFEGSPKFFVLGEEKIAPAIVSALTEQNGRKQTLKMVLFCGTGGRYGIESISDIRMNGVPIDSFKNVLYVTRLGTADQAEVKGFEKIGWPYEQNTTLTEGDKWEYATKQAVDEIAIGFTWYSGLYRFSSHENITYADAEYSIKVKGESDKEWRVVKPPKADNRAQESISDIFNFIVWASEDWLRGDDGHWIARAATTGVHRMIALIPLGKKEKYQIKVKAKNGNDAKRTCEGTITRVEEIVYDSRSYAGNAILAIQAVASSQLSGGFPEVTCVVRGWKCYDPRTSAAAWTRNPALCVREVLLNSSDSCGDWITETDLWDGAGEAWRVVADRCETNAASSGDHREPRWQMDLVVDSLQPARDWLDHMLMTFRAALIEYDGKVGIIQDVASTSVRTFDARQIPTAGRRPVLANRDGRAMIREDQLLLDQQANSIRAYYHDRDDDYNRRQTPTVEDAAALTTDPLVEKELTLWGVTRRTQATRECRYWLNADRLSANRQTIGVGVGDLDFLPFDVITVYADSPPWTSGSTLQVVGIEYDNEQHAGMLSCRTYTASMYADTSDTLPAKALSLSRAEALKAMKSAPRGADSIKAREIES